MADEITPDEIDRIQQKTIERIKAEASAYPAKDVNEDKITSRFVEDCIYANELGDGILFATIHRNNFLFNNTTQAWFFWNGHTWAPDNMERVLSAVEDVVDRLLLETLEISNRIAWLLKKGENGTADLEKKRSDIHKRIYRLRQDKGRNMCIKFARSCRAPIAIEGNELDMNPWLLGCKNGVIDLERGEFRDGRREDMISMSSPVEWKGINEPAPLWEKTILEVMYGNQEIVDYLQRLLGYGITGLNTEHIFPVWEGKGRNGKGMIVEVISKVLGPLCGTIQSEMLLDQFRPQSASAPSPDIMTLKGLRLAFASETDEDRRFSPSKVKWLTGGDELIGRNPHDRKPTRFFPTHLMILLSNYKPAAPADDFAFWERLQLTHFKLSFVNRDPLSPDERRADKDLAARLLQEGPGILAWLVRGCLLYQKHGINPPKEIIDYTLQYKQDEDNLGAWIAFDCFQHPGVHAPSTELYDRFTAWFEKHVSKKVPKQKKFGVWMAKRFERLKINGIINYAGIGFKENQGTNQPGTDDGEQNDQENLF